MEEYKKIGKNARNVMLLSSMVFSIISTIVLLVVWFFFGEKWPGFVNYFLLFTGGIIWLISFIEPFIRCERYRYRFTEEEIDIREGFLFIERNVVPIERLHKIAMLSGPFDRIFGLAKVIVTTAGGDVCIRFLEVGQAEKIVENLKKRINLYAAAQKREDRDGEKRGANGNDEE